jgi:hypothetical protein
MEFSIPLAFDYLLCFAEGSMTLLIPFAFDYFLCLHWSFKSTFDPFCFKILLIFVLLRFCILFCYNVFCQSMFVFCWYNEATKVDVACLIYPCHVVPIGDSKPLPCKGIHCYKQSNVLKKLIFPSTRKNIYHYYISTIQVHMHTCQDPLLDLQGNMLTTS